MNQKGFVNIIVLIAIIVVLGSIGVYFILRQQSQPTPISGAPISGPITVIGEITCLPKKGPGPHTQECAIGLRGTDGQHYGLKNLFRLDPESKFSVTGLDVKVSGIFTPEEMLGPGGAKYDAVGIVDVASIEAGTGTIQPEDPSTAGLAPYPDLPLTSLPTESVPVEFVVEHRSALNGKSTTIRGVVAGTLLGEKACPPGLGMCAQPSIYLADTTEESRNKLYDLRVLVSEEEQESNYPIGGTKEIQITVDGNKFAVIGRKTY